MIFRELTCGPSTSSQPKNSVDPTATTNKRNGPSEPGSEVPQDPAALNKTLQARVSKISTSTAFPRRSTTSTRDPRAVRKRVGCAGSLWQILVRQHKRRCGSVGLTDARLPGGWAWPWRDAAACQRLGWRQWFAHERIHQWT
jgi:hypothetical protein